MTVAAPGLPCMLVQHNITHIHVHITMALRCLDPLAGCKSIPAVYLLYRKSKQLSKIYGSLPGTQKQQLRTWLYSLHAYMQLNSQTSWLHRKTQMRTNACIHKSMLHGGIHAPQRQACMLFHLHRTLPDGTISLCISAIFYGTISSRCSVDSI